MWEIIKNILAKKACFHDWKLVKEVELSCIHIQFIYISAKSVERLNKLMFDKAMKQYLTLEQTAKLLDLGFEKPKSISSIKVTGNIITTANDLIGEPTSVMGGRITANYSIGELLSFLPTKIESEEDDFIASFQMTADWELYYTTYSDIFYYVNNNELVDALYDMCIKLKEEGVI